MPHYHRWPEFRARQVVLALKSNEQVPLTGRQKNGVPEGDTMITTVPTISALSDMSKERFRFGVLSAK